MYERTRQGAWRRRPEEAGQRAALRPEKTLRANHGGSGRPGSAEDSGQRTTDNNTSDSQSRPARNIMTTTTFAPGTDKLQTFCDLPTEQALPRAAAFVAGLVRDRSFLRSHVIPLLEEGRGAGRWYVARCWDGPDRSYSLQIFIWPPGTRTMVHDHSSWGAYACAAGTVFEERYERLDDGSRFEHARLEEDWHLSWSPEDGASTVLPGDEGIHRVGNPYEDVAVSVHLYGPRMSPVDGRDYDPSQDYVCDRVED
jgi:predicted metal-dependent enzyme (double-stranded beta helix superfamily)